MELKTIQAELNANTFTEKFLIFCEGKKNDRFVSSQYVNKIASIIKKPIWYVDSLEEFYGNSYSIVDSYIYVYNAEECELQMELSRYNNLFICCNSCSAVGNDKEHIVKVPELKNVDILEYVESRLNCSEEVAEKVINRCGSNPYCIDNEVDKLLSFNRRSVDIGLRKLEEDPLFGNVGGKMYDAVNAILTKDVNRLRGVYDIFYLKEFNCFGFLAMLHNGFINVAKIQLAKFPTAESTGLTSGQFYMVKKNINHYSKESLITAIKKICAVDRDIKLGNMLQDDAISRLVLELMYL